MNLNRRSFGTMALKSAFGSAVALAIPSVVRASTTDGCVLTVRLDPKRNERPTLTLYDDALRALYTFPIAAGQYVLQLPMRGKVFRVARKEPWTPTVGIRARWAEKGKILPASISYGEPGYPLGTGFIWVAWENHRQYQYIGIHGTNEPEYITDPAKGPYVSSGCIRMLVDDWEKVAAVVERSETLVRFIPVGTDVARYV